MVAGRYPADACCALSRFLPLPDVMRRYTRGFDQFRGAAITAPVLPMPNFGADPLQWVIGAVNALMKRQPAAQDLLAQHAGRTVHLYVGQPRFALTIGHDGTLSAADAAVLPDVTLRVDVVRLLQSGWMPGRPLPESTGLLHVTGDAAMAQTLSTLARHWRPDLEDLLSEMVGDVAAVQIARGARSLARGLFEAGEKFTQNLAEFLAYETRDLTPGPVLQTWQQQFQSYKRQMIEMDQKVGQLSRRLHEVETARTRKGPRSAQGDGA